MLRRIKNVMRNLATLHNTSKLCTHLLQEREEAFEKIQLDNESLSSNFFSLLFA